MKETTGSKEEKIDQGKGGGTSEGTKIGCVSVPYCESSLLATI